jgi:hypothetical protein
MRADLLDEQIHGFGRSVGAPPEVWSARIVPPAVDRRREAGQFGDIANTITVDRWIETRR